MKRLILLVFLLLGCNAANAALTDGLTNPGESKLLSVNDAFAMTTTVTGPDTLDVHWKIADGYYLYTHKFKFKVLAGKVSIDPASIQPPKGIVEVDPSFGKVEIIYHNADFKVHFFRQSQAQTPVTLQIRYQGCKENVVCYPPQRRKVNLVLAATSAPVSAAPQQGTTVAAAPNTSTTAAAAQPAAAPKLSETDAITQKLKSSGWFLNLITFFGFGLLLSLTPCVFPMIPILSGIIVGQGEKITPMKGFTLSLAYVGAMALTYAVAGIIAASLHFNLQAASQNVWVISIFSLIFILLALSMFGFYEIQLPSSWQTRLSSISDSQQGGSMIGAFVMGALSAIIVGPCVAPPLAGALLYISQTGNQLLGGLALFTLGIGMGVPLLIIGGSAGSFLPRAGMWMESIKKIFGVLLLAVAIWFISRVVPPAVELYMWAALLIVTAIYMGALDQMQENATWRRLWKGIGIIMLVYGIVLVIGASSGSDSVLKPLQGIAQVSTGTGGGSAAGATEQYEHGLPFKRIKSYADLQAAVKKASQNGQNVMLDFYADWCISCKEMEAYTFPDPAVRAALKNVVLLQADVTANDDTDTALMQKLGIVGPPAILFYGKDGKELRSYRVVGFVKAAKFAAHIREAVGS